MPPDLSSLPDAFDQRVGLPRPDWVAIRQWIEEHTASDDLDVAWTVVATRWLDRLRLALPGDYRIEQSENFQLLCAAGNAASDRLLRGCEYCLDTILRALPDVARDEGYGKRVVLAFHDWPAYYDYLADFFPEEGAFGPSMGAFLDEEYGHFALCTRSIEQLDRTIAHEMTHALLRHLPLPLWLNEGVTQVVEDLVVGSSSFAMDAELARRHRAYWNERSIHSFWSGDSFRVSDDGQELSYSLAEVLYRNLAADYPGKTGGFLNAAHFCDAGAEALRTTCQVDLADRVRQFLGPGQWAPRSNYERDERPPLIAGAGGYRTFWIASPAS